jgi:hypothetical protein
MRGGVRDVPRIPTTVTVNRWRELLGETIAEDLIREAYADAAKGEHLKPGSTATPRAAIDVND